MATKTDTSAGSGLAGAADPRWAWARFEPDDERPWSPALAGHLYRRAGFGARWEQLRQAVDLGPQRTIDRLLEPEADVSAFSQTQDEYEAAAARGDVNGLRAWWLRRMIQTPHPLLEKMTFFWHGHFAVSNRKVKSAQLMNQYVGQLRRHALGSFGEMLEGVANDPAVLIWLDATANRKALPSEHFARVLLEVYTLGKGEFTDKDVSEAARAFTGWFVFRERLRFIPREQDTRVKKVLGREGQLDGPAVVKVLLEQRATARTLVRKLYRCLISEAGEPGDDLIAPLVESFAAGYDVAGLVETMLRSNLFFSPAAYRQRIKSPVELALGIIRGMESLVPTVRLGQDLAALGQDLFHPPTFRGWEGGRHWINSATLVGRSNLAGALLSGTKPYGEKPNPAETAKKYGHATPREAGQFFVDLFLQGDVDDAVRRTLLQKAAPASAAAGKEAAGVIRRLAHAVVSLPEFQLA